MKTVEYVDRKKRRFLVQIPDNSPASEAKFGNPLGPPVLEKLNLPEELEVRLHNELYIRKLFTLADVRRRRGDVIAAIRAALSLDVERVMEAYADG